MRPSSRDHFFDLLEEEEVVCAGLDAGEQQRVYADAVQDELPVLRVDQVARHLGEAVLGQRGVRWFPCSGCLCV